MKAMTQDVYGSADVLALNDIDVPVVGDDEMRRLRFRLEGAVPPA